MTETCPRCGHKLCRTHPNYPAAERTYLAFSGRGLYRIVGQSGLWYCQRKQQDPESETTFARGPMGEQQFYRAVEAEERIRSAMNQEESK